MGRRASTAKEKRPRQTVSKWGNSLAVRIPAHAAYSVGLSEGSEIDIAVKADALVIKASRPRRYNLKELVDQITQENRPPVINWGKPVGKEVW